MEVTGEQISKEATAAFIARKVGNPDFEDIYGASGSFAVGYFDGYWAGMTAARNKKQSGSGDEHST